MKYKSEIGYCNRRRVYFKRRYHHERDSFDNLARWKNKRK
jgi:hypothetical protein